jgi:cardiolipin synthase (CMP-forming)
MSAPAAPLTQIPNALTLARFALIPAFVLLVLDAESGHSVTAAVVFGVAAITDQVDGYLARRWQVESEFGKYADPLADRLMIDAAVVLLWLADRLPTAALLIVLVRDVILLAGSRIATRRGYVFEVTFLGKTATWVLYAALAGVLVTRSGADWPLALFWTGVALAALAGLGYVIRVGRALR